MRSVRYFKHGCISPRKEVFMGWFDQSGKGYSDKSKPTGYGSGTSSPQEGRIKLDKLEQARARKLIAAGHSRGEALRIILDDRV